MLYCKSCINWELKMEGKVFISVGSAYTDAQKKFVDAIIQWLQDEGLSPQMLGKTVYPDKQPLKVIQETMMQCDGTLVIAFERIFVNDGQEKRGGTGSMVLHSQIIPTVWNQIETAMAYGLQQPILVLAEEGSRREGLLDDKFEWLVLPVKVDADIVNSREFVGTLRSWFKNLKEYKAQREAKEKKLIEGINPGTLTVAQLFNLMRPNQVWKCVGVLTSIIILAFSFGRLVGKFL